MNLTATIYSKDICPFCVKAKNLLAIKGISYDEYIISSGVNEAELGPNQYYATLEELLEKVPTARSVPQIWLNDGSKSTYIGGFTELEAFFRE